MNKILFFIIICLVFTLNLSAQTSLHFGSNIGGAIPTKSTEGSSAILIPGAFFGVSNQFQISEKISFNPQISFELKHFGYSAIQKKDTVVESEVAGIIANIPTYYTATITGVSRFVTLNADIPVEIKFGQKIAINLGVYGNYKLYSSDAINVHVQIGEGGLIPDVDSAYNNRDNINSFEGGFLLGGKYAISDKLSLNFVGYRALSRHYKLDTILDENGQDTPFFFTMFRLGIVYNFQN